MTFRIPGARLRPIHPTAAAVLLILIGVLAAYGSGLFAGFHFDDKVLILENDLLREPGHLAELLTTPFLGAYYRPLVLLSFLIDYRLWGANPLGFHLTQILLHFLNACLVFLLIRTLWNNTRAAMITAVLFAVHPIQAVAVDYIADRGNLLAALLQLSALLCLLRVREQRDKTTDMLLLSGLLFAAALFARENALLFPALAVIVLYASGEHRTLPGRVFALAALAVSLGFYAMRRSFVPLSGIVLPGAASLLSWKGIASFSYVIFSYVRGMILPGDIHFIRQIALPAWGGAERVVFPLFLAALIAACVIAARRRGPVFFGLAWFLVSSLPLYGFMFARPHTGLFIQDNQAYLACIGPLFLIALFLDRLRVFLPRILGSLITAGLCCLFIAKALAFGRLYGDEEAFLKEWLRVCPRCELATLYLGSFYRQAGRPQEALAFFRRSIVGVPTDAKALAGIGALYLDTADTERARSAFGEAVTLDPTTKEAWLGLAQVSLRARQTTAAERYLRESIRLAPAWPLPRLELIKLYAHEGRNAQAVEEALALRKAAPCVETTHYMLVALYLAGRNPQAALDAAQGVLSITADLPQACRDLAALFEEAGYAPLARAFREQAGHE
ncbi:MAG: tetratricopeptide repeat protein [Deltaproteobacteria bacterium]